MASLGQVTADGDTFHIVTIKGTVLKAPDLPECGSSVVIDCRPLAHDKAVANVSVIAGLLPNPEVLQIWFRREEEEEKTSSCQGLFHEIKERIKKSLRREQKVSDSKFSELMSKVSCHLVIAAPCSIYPQGKRLRNFMDGLLDLSNLNKSHPGLVHLTVSKCKLAKRLLRANACTNAEDGGVIINSCSSINNNNKRPVYGDHRRPKKRTFQILRSFQESEPEAKQLRLLSATPTAESKGADKFGGSRGGGHDFSATRKCYMCKWRFINIADVDKPICNACTKENEAMKVERCNLGGKFAVVTGARIKIGIHIALRLLRNGCFVIATSRFPGDALHRFQSQSDYPTWQDRLKICYLELEDLKSVKDFLDYVRDTVPHLDILINNAAQTIAKPPPYYAVLRERERRLVDNFFKDPDCEGMIGLARDENHAVSSANMKQVLNYDDSKEALLVSGDKEVVANDADRLSLLSPVTKKMSDDDATNPKTYFAAVGKIPAAAAAGESDLSSSSEQQQQQQQIKLFPRNVLDVHGEQLDLRERNSWTLNLNEVPLSELLQVLTVNAVGPFLLTSRLKPLLVSSPSERKFVVNVSAMEGQFSRASKGHRHPHTNMAKAALNMMTRTSGLEFQLDGIFMTAVDTGWVTDERPFQQARYEASRQSFVVPLDCEDGAARVTHPIFHGLRDVRSGSSSQPYFAVFLKDFKVHPW